MYKSCVTWRRLRPCYIPCTAYSPKRSQLTRQLNCALCWEWPGFRTWALLREGRGRCVPSAIGTRVPRRELVNRAVTSLEISFIHSFIHCSRALSWSLVSSFVIFFTLTVGLLRLVTRPSQGRYIHTGQHKHGINAHTRISITWVRFEPTISVFERANIAASMIDN
jgi:hypothetical protein